MEYHTYTKTHIQIWFSLKIANPGQPKHSQGILKTLQQHNLLNYW